MLMQMIKRSSLSSEYSLTYVVELLSTYLLKLLERDRAVAVFPLR